MQEELTETALTTSLGCFNEAFFAVKEIMFP